MSTEYGVSIKNKFAFLPDSDEEADPEVLVERAAKEKREQLKLAKQQPKPAAAPAQAARPVANNENRRPAGGQNRGPRPPRDFADRFGEKRVGGPREGGRDGPRPPRREGGGPPRPRRNGDFKPRERAEGEHGNEEVDGDGRYPPRRFQRRDGPPREGGPRDGPRFPRGPRTDRVSGSEKTGVRAQSKKDGHGRGNWGDQKDELVGETEQLNLSENKENGDSAPTEEKPAVVGEEVEQVPEEPEAPQLTLAEWKAQQKVEKREVKTRQANEGADAKALQKFVPLKKDEDDENESEEEGEIQQTKRQQRAKALDIHINFNDPNRRDNRGPRPDRRGPRPDYNSRPAPGSSGARGPRRAAAHIDLAHDFPALGAH